MSDLTRISKQISYLLRHSNELPMDSHGWTSIDGLLQKVRISRSMLHRVVDTNNKKRFEINGDLIRACQGHSTTSVTTSSMEDTWTLVDTEGCYLYHGTKSSNVDSILRSGLNSGTRTHVHLAESPNSNIGKRYNVDVLLKVDGTKLKQLGVKVYRSSNGVLLAQSIPAEAIIVM